MSHTARRMRMPCLLRVSVNLFPFAGVGRSGNIPLRSANKGTNLNWYSLMIPDMASRFHERKAWCRGRGLGEGGAPTMTTLFYLSWNVIQTPNPSLSDVHLCWHKLLTNNKGQRLTSSSCFASLFFSSTPSTQYSPSFPHMRAISSYCFYNVWILQT